MALLRVIDFNVLVDDSIVELASARCELDLYRASKSQPSFTLNRVAQVPLTSRRLEFTPGQGPSIFCDVRGDVVDVKLPDSPLAAEIALRLAFHLAFVRQGAVFLHAGAFAFDDLGIVAVGASGAGKSTISRLAVGLGAQLLSDESVALLPTDRVYGSPFRSEPDLPGEILSSKLARIVVLKQGAQESIEPLPPHRAAALLLEQTYRSDAGDLSHGVVLARVARLCENPGAHVFTFRALPAAAEFLRAWVKS